MLRGWAINLGGNLDAFACDGICLNNSGGYIDDIINKESNTPWKSTKYSNLRRKLFLSQMSFQYHPNWFKMILSHIYIGPKSGKLLECLKIHLAKITHACRGQFQRVAQIASFRPKTLVQRVVLRSPSLGPSHWNKCDVLVQYFEPEIWISNLILGSKLAPALVAMS